MSAFLVDEMFPIAAAALLRDTYGHDAVHVSEIGLQATEDTQVAAAARAQGRAVVTENVADFAAERDVVLVFILRGTCQQEAGRQRPSRKSSTAGRRPTPSPTSAITGHRRDEFAKSHRLFVAWTGPPIVSALHVRRVCCTRPDPAVAVGPGPRSWPDASTSSRSPERRPVGVCRAPVPARGDHAGGPLVPAVRTLVSRCRGAAGPARASRSTTSPVYRWAAAVHPAVRRGRPPAPARHRRPLVRRRGLRQGRRPLAVPVPGGRPVRPGHRRHDVRPAGHRRRPPVLHPSVKVRPGAGGGDHRQGWPAPG